MNSCLIVFCGAGIGGLLSLGAMLGFLTLFDITLRNSIPMVAGRRGRCSSPLTPTPIASCRRNGDG